MRAPPTPNGLRQLLLSGVETRLLFWVDLLHAEQEGGGDTGVAFQAPEVHVWVLEAEREVTFEPLPAPLRPRRQQ